MKTIKEIESKIKELKESLARFCGEDEESAERIGARNALEWVIDKKEWDIVDI